MTERQVWTADEVDAAGFRFGHPLDPDAEAMVHALGRLSGLKRTGINLVRIPPGRRAFPLHRHLVEEEWTYILSGEAEVTLGEQTVTLGPGGFVAFMPGGPAHQVANLGETEVVCLMGGDNLTHDTVDFPEQKKRLTKTPAGIEIGAAESFEPFDFFSRTPLPMGTE